MTMFDFAHWCFGDFEHGLWTLIIAGCCVDGAAKLLTAARGINKDD